MKRVPVIVIFDVGKTNKKLFLFDENYEPRYEGNTRLEEIADEDGFPCEDVHALTEWVKNSFQRLLKDPGFEIRAVNFSAYGASFVYLDDSSKVFLPLYNYLKPYPSKLQKQFYDKYGGESVVARQTASPVLGNLNSGMQLYRLKYEKRDEFDRIRCALHLPQYLSFVLSGKLCSDITSVGCHTHLWDFENNRYHRWVKKESIELKLSPIAGSGDIAEHFNDTITIGVGLHDSSAALIPYLASFQEPFVLLSTGTWCISLNPFNRNGLTDQELQQDCLCYLSYQGHPVKASRLFAGHEHEEQIKKLASHFNKHEEFFTNLSYNEAYRYKPPIDGPIQSNRNGKSFPSSAFAERNLDDFETCEEAYHQLIKDIVDLQVRSTQLVLDGSPAKRIFVDGGFSKNPVYMNLLSAAMQAMEVYAASVAQASAIGAAVVMHRHWNGKPHPKEIIELKLYSSKRK